MRRNGANRATLVAQSSISEGMKRSGYIFSKLEAEAKLVKT